MKKLILLLAFVLIGLTVSAQQRPSVHYHVVGKTYSLNDNVSVDGVIYRANVASTTNTPPHADWTDITAGFSLAGHDVTELDDVSSAGSGQIITGVERTKLDGIETGATVDQDFQDVYDTSTPPKVTTTLAKGALIIQGGSGNDSDLNLDIKNNSGNTAFTIESNGQANYYNTVGLVKHFSNNSLFTELFHNTDTDVNEAQFDYFSNVATPDFFRFITGTQNLSIKSDGNITWNGDIDLAIGGQYLINGVPVLGDVIGPASSTDNAIARYDLATGKLIQDSGVTIDDGDTVGNVSSIALNTAAGVSVSQGEIAWNADEETVDIGLNGAILQAGQETHYHVRNNTGVQIDNGTPVMATGTLGVSGRITIGKMDGSSITNAKYFLGITTEDIADGTDGKVTFFGKVREIDTSTWSEGDILWVDNATTGTLTNIQPTTGSRLPIAFVITDHAVNGVIAVRATDGTYLAEAHDTSIASPANGEVLKHNGTNWVNSPITAADVSIATGIGSPTIDQVQEYFDNTGSSGFFGGGVVSDGGAGTVDITAGSGFIRTTNDGNAELQSFKWAASMGMAVTDNTTQYIYVDDAGTISLSMDEFLEAPDKIQIGVVTKEAGAIIDTFSLGVRLEESIGQAGRFIRRVHGIERDNRRGGFIVGQSEDVNRDISVSAGTMWWGRTEYPFTSFDTSGADVMQTYSISGQESSTATQWPNEQYDNAGTLTTMTNNRWANLFFYVIPNNGVIIIYGRSEFTSEALAAEEGVPSTSLPTKITETGLLIARLTFQKSSNIATISSAFQALFANASVTDHGDLAGLSDAADHPYALLIDGSRNLAGNLAVDALVTIDGIDIGVDVAANTAKTTNATHTGDVTGSTDLSLSLDVVGTIHITNGAILNEDISDDTISEVKLDMNNAPVDGHVNTYRSATGMGWEASTVGIARHPDSPVAIDSIYVGTVAQIAGAGLGADVLAFPTDASNNLEDLDDVTETTITTGDRLEWNGSAWVNVANAPQTATGDGTTTIVWGTDNFFHFQFGAFNETFTFTAPTKPGTFLLKLIQDSTGSRTATWPASVEWPGGTAPTLTTTATTGTDIITFYYDGTDYFAVSSLDFQ